MDKEEYVRLQREYQTLRRRIDEEDEQANDDDLFEIGLKLLENNSFDNPLTRDTADHIINHHIDISMDGFGGYRLYEAVGFQAEGRNYVVIAYGGSEHDGGKEALQGIVFAVEGEPEQEGQ